MISLTSPVRTRAHDWPAGAKLAGLCVATVGLFFVENLWAQALIFVAVAGVYLLPGAAFARSGWQKLRILWPFVLIVSVWHLWTGEIEEGAVVIIRLASAVALANLVTMTTRLSDMTDVVRRLLTPFERLGFPARVVELCIALVIRLTPVMVDKGIRLTEAWRARSNRRAGWRIILPVTILALDDADQVAEALKARGGTHS